MNNGYHEFADMADAFARSATSRDDRESYTRVAKVARSMAWAAAGAGDSYQRVARAFQEQDAESEARSAEITSSLNASIEAAAPTAGFISFDLNFDTVQDNLPNWMLLRLERIADQLENARALNHHMFDEKQDLIKRRGELYNKLRMWTEPAVAARYSIGKLQIKDESHPDVIKWRKDIANIDAKMAKVDEKLAALRPHRALDKLQERCREYIVRNRSHEFVQHKGQAAKKPVVDDLGGAIDGVRKTLAELKADLRALQARPRPSADVKAAARKLVDATAKPPVVAGAVDHGDAILWPIAGITAEVVGGVELDGKKIAIPKSGAAAFGGTNDALGILLWAFRDPILTALDREIDLYADDENALSDEDRVRGVATLSMKILAAERDEEALIRMADEREVPIPRRPDADPRAVLGLADSFPAMVEDF
jgi:hypothetical protein